MEPHRRSPHPHLITDNMPTFPPIPCRTASSTPISSPGLFSPTNPRPGLLPVQSTSDTPTPIVATSSPYLHPLQTRKVRETHKALVDLDLMTGRKIINQYEVIEELGRGVHGKVKLARNLENSENVAIKIIPRFSKKRRLGKVTASPQDKTKKEIAILKKIRHPNVVALLEIIDDPELKKIYMVLEHVELGEIVWRKKGLPSICNVERQRIEQETRGEPQTAEQGRYFQLMEQRQKVKELKRARMRQLQRGAEDFWSIEYGAAVDEDSDLQATLLARDDDAGIHPPPSSVPSRPESRAQSLSHSHGRAAGSVSRISTPQPSDCDVSSVDVEAESESETPGPSPAQPISSTVLEGTMYGAYMEDPMLRGRSPSMADSIISHMSSVDYNIPPHDAFADDFSYVPCFTFDDARAVFRDTVLGLEYLHYEGVVHRDIKPANLLWSRDHQVKISDFGVSYFGRPIRDGEADELVSESEARDFDDDLELAKTVGTPAFFAPELCYTDPTGEQPRISEQIDVWSLGVTLYCLIFARIPFLAEDEFQMFRRIAQEEVYIPRKRLRPVDPRHSPSSTSLYKRVNSETYRDDSSIEYEDVDDLLYDLLRKMFIKNPEKRIRLREVKRHPWVVQGLPNLMGWIDETDPSRRGRKIEVDSQEIRRAVVPLTLFEKAKSAVKALGRAIHPRTERTDIRSRRRAASSAASSVGDISTSIVSTPNIRDARRKSLRGDDYFATVRESDHPLAQSVTATPQESPGEEDDGPYPQQITTYTGGELTRSTNGFAGDFDYLSNVGVPASPSTSLTSAMGLISHRHMRNRSSSNAFLILTPARETHTMPTTPAGGNSGNEDPMASLRKSRDVQTDDPSRSRSVDRGLFANHDKRAEAKVALSTAVAPGNLELPRRPLTVGNPDMGSTYDSSALSSPTLFSPKDVRMYQHGQQRLDPSKREGQSKMPDLGQQPLTTQRVLGLEAETPPPRAYSSSTPESFTRAQAQMIRRRTREAEEQAKREELIGPRPDPTAALSPCPPSPDDEEISEKPRPPSRDDTVGTMATSASASADSIMSTFTNPSEVMSPISMTNLSSRKSEGHISSSDHSLPALFSGASSISADAEAEFLTKPSPIDRPSLIDTTDSLTPPALAKEPLEGFPIAEGEQFQTLLLGRRPSNSDTAGFLLMATVENEEDDSDSDEGLTMAPKKRGRAKEPVSSAIGRTPTHTRRDTQTSVGSTDTAKKILMQSQ